ncbi:Fic family protein [Phycicoccus sp. BSK3Z-2]|uniref:Fic family protein n=1 Tax=Phycicoccus avicenniae TaxID=2828860 RepID=A0A941D6T3_9MICO|nr:Fic/DOC family N-terminal domain-containing protein [Phycicoccus avicenniae]MBR7741840.1 Fic family protein [Phycicoccus avicenniae]
MDTAALENSPVGQLVPISGHDERQRPFSHVAFLPKPLPTTLELSSATWTGVAAATEALGRLHQACASIPNPRLLIAPALAKEAVDTSALEGTYGALADVLESRLTDVRPKSAEVAEIRAYEQIAQLGFEWVRHQPITIGLLEHLQGILAKDSRQAQRDPGKVREHQVVIGPEGCTVYEARYIPPPPDDRLRAGLDQWQEWLAADVPLPAPVKAAMAHYQFESLHPFGDGNGRIGRLVIVLQLMRSGILNEPALTISPWLRARRDEYQGHLLAVSQTGNWDPWVAFFCRAICEQSMASVRVVDALNTWLTTQRQTLNDRYWTGTIAKLVEDLVDWPVITASFVQEKYEVSAPTAKSAIDRLMESGVLRETTGKSYGRVYAAMDVINAVESFGTSGESRPSA